jgi:tetratricopeptide (TPR) repeat protein
MANLRSFARVSILSERRRVIHERAGEAIETRYAERMEDYLSELARHYRLGNNPAKAVLYSQLAAERAVNRAAYGEAADAATAALKLLDRLPEGTGRLRAELDLRMIENSASVVLQGFASREHQLAVERICELTEQLGETALLLGGLANLANLYFARGEPDRTLELGRRCVDMAADTQDAEAMASAHLTVAYGAYGCGYLNEAVSYYRSGALHAEQFTQQPVTLPVIPLSAGATQICSALQLLGRGTEALDLAEKGLTRARESQHLFSLGLALTVGDGSISIDANLKSHARMLRRLSRWRRSMDFLSGKPGGITITAGLSPKSSTWKAAFRKWKKGSRTFADLAACPNYPLRSRRWRTPMRDWAVTSRRSPC